MNAQVAPFVVFACGNPSRGDDALGPLLLARLQEWLDTEGLAGGFELIEDFQFQIEHALDLEGRTAALFIDAGEGTEGPYTLLPVRAAEGPGHSTHAISPAAVLSVYQRIVGRQPPPTSLLCVRGESFALGEGLSLVARENLERAWPALQQYCQALRERREIGVEPPEG